MGYRLVMNAAALRGAEGPAGRGFARSALKPGLEETQGAWSPKPLAFAWRCGGYRCNAPVASKAVALPPVGVKLPLSVAVKPPARSCLASARSASVMQPLGLAAVSNVDGIVIVVAPWLSVSDVSSNVAP